jgi:hypothetical protein
VIETLAITIAGILSVAAGVALHAAYVEYHGRPRRRIAKAEAARAREWWRVVSEALVCQNWRQQ